MGHREMHIGRWDGDVLCVCHPPQLHLKKEQSALNNQQITEEALWSTHSTPSVPNCIINMMGSWLFATSGSVQNPPLLFAPRQSYTSRYSRWLLTHFLKCKRISQLTYANNTKLYMEPTDHNVLSRVNLKFYL